jgi:hypothetical protein
MCLAQVNAWTTKKVKTMRKAGLILLMSTLTAASLAFPQSAPAQDKPAASTLPSKPDFSILQGRWVRPDGGYTITIKGVDANGDLEAAYFNQSSIPFAKAHATMEANSLNVFFELRAGGYAGSTYTLTYDPVGDRLAGVYFQAVAQQKFNIYFARAK